MSIKKSPVTIQDVANRANVSIKTVSRVINNEPNVAEKTIKKVETPKGSTDDPKHISDFIQNVDRKTFSSIQNHLDDQKKSNSFKNYKGKCSKCSKELETPIMFDNANFFV